MHLPFDFAALGKEMELFERKARVETALVGFVQNGGRADRRPNLAADRLAERVAEARAVVADLQAAPPGASQVAMDEECWKWRAHAIQLLEMLVEEALAAAHRRAAAAHALKRVIHLCAAGGGGDGNTALSLAAQGGHVTVVVHLLGALRHEQALALAPFRFFLASAKFAGNAPEVAPGNRCVVSKLGMSLGIYHLANINKLIADYAGVLRKGGAAVRALVALAVGAAGRLPSTVPSPWGSANEEELHHAPVPHLRRGAE